MTSPVRAADLTVLCTRAAQLAGADRHAAALLAAATVAAEQARNRAVGIAHFFDYLQAYRDGRIASGVAPVVTRPAPACLVSDARDGLAQVAFDAASAAVRARTRQHGVACLWLRSCFTCGELGHYPRQLAAEGFVAVAAANSPALMAVGGSGTPVLGTNPMAYAVPRPGRTPFVVDQATSATAYVNVRDAARDSRSIPPGWAVGPDGKPTTDATRALSGALLPFGAHRGGNVALLVELLATLAGASFSVDAPPFDSGQDPPGIGVFVLCLDPALFGGPERTDGFLARLQTAHGVSLPAMADQAPADPVFLDTDLHRRLLDASAPHGFVPHNASPTTTDERRARNT